MFHTVSHLFCSKRQDFFLFVIFVMVRKSHMLCWDLAVMGDLAQSCPTSYTCHCDMLPWGWHGSWKGPEDGSFPCPMSSDWVFQGRWGLVLCTYSSLSDIYHLQAFPNKHLSGMRKWFVDFPVKGLCVSCMSLQANSTELVSFPVFQPACPSALLLLLFTWETGRGSKAKAMSLFSCCFMVKFK